LGRRQAV